MRFTLPLLFVLVFLTACGGKASLLSDGTVEDRSGPVAVDLTPVYAEYTAGITGYGRPAILFFAATADPFSDTSDRRLRSAYAASGVTISTYRVDFEAAPEEKIRYGVFLPDTFILLDASGDRIGSLVHPTADELNILLSSGSFPE